MRDAGQQRAIESEYCGEEVKAPEQMATQRKKMSWLRVTTPGQDRVVRNTQNLLRLFAAPGAQNSSGPRDQRYSTDCECRIDLWSARRWILVLGVVVVVTEQNFPDVFSMRAHTRAESQGQCQKRVLQDFRQCSHSLFHDLSGRHRDC